MRMTVYSREIETPEYEKKAITFNDAVMTQIEHYSVDQIYRVPLLLGTRETNTIPFRIFNA